MGERIRRLFRGQLISALFYIALGLLLALMPVESIHILCKIVFGIVLIAAGAYHVAIHLLERSNATVLDLFSGVLMIILGVFLFRNPLVIVKLLPVLIGSLILVDSLWNLKGVWKLRKNRRSTWKTLFLGCLVFLALGVALIMNPFTIVKDTIIFAGCILVCNGLLDLLFMGLVRYGLKKAEEEREALENVVAEEDAPAEDVVPEAPAYADWNSHVQNLDADGRDVENEESTVEADCRDVENEEANVEADAQDVENDGQNVETVTQNEETDPQKVEPDLQNVENDEQNVGADTQDLEHEPQEGVNG